MTTETQLTRLPNGKLEPGIKKKIRRATTTPGLSNKNRAKIHRWLRTTPAVGVGSPIDLALIAANEKKSIWAL